MPTERVPSARPEGTNQRQRILSVALSLMATQGVDGTSMRNLAAATGLNVASLYHYFPSKRDLLVAVLEERGFVDDLSASQPSLSRDPAAGLADLLNDILQSMLEVEEFIRLMMGEVMRGDDTAYAVGNDLFAATQASLERWLGEQQPALGTPVEQAAWPACCGACWWACSSSMWPGCSTMPTRPTSSGPAPTRWRPSLSRGSPSSGRSDRHLTTRRR